MLTLYGSRRSGSAAIEAALALIGADYRLVEGAEWERTPGYDELKSVNPLAQLPTLVLDDGTVLTESAAILIHLGLAHPQSRLLPDDPSQRAQSIRGLVYIVANCYAAIGVLDYPQRWCSLPDTALHEAMRVGTRQRLHGLWDTFADQFPARPWLGGERLGALDLLATVVSRWDGARQHLAQSRPGLHDLLVRIDAHPAVAEVFARHWPPPA